MLVLGLSAILISGCATAVPLEQKVGCAIFDRGPENPEDSLATQRWIVGHNAAYKDYCG